METTELFSRSVGNATDIVEKEMYTFEDRDGQSVSLRPEETAGVVRAYLENGLYSNQSLNKLYYMGPMFRRERPQAGRYRQFHQIGAEFIGSYLPSADFEVIMWLNEYFKKIKITDIVLQINSAGCEKCRPGYSMTLKESLESKIGTMCADCQRRFKRNIFRVLDCKLDQCKKTISELPVITESLCTDCSAHFGDLKKMLDAEGIKYTINPHLVRGLDYYTRTVFEVLHTGLGSQNAVAAGGRYDLLIQDMGGLPTGAVGFSIGEERLTMVMQNLNIVVPQEKINVYFVSLDKESYAKNLEQMYLLRKDGISADIDYEQKSLKAQMRIANKLSAKYVVIRGEEELKTEVATVKNMQDGTEEKIGDKVFVDEMNKRIGKG
jgi:histidyl-tRNA synthetase